MATVSANIHLRDSDRPFAKLLEGGQVALWLEGVHIGPTLIGSPEALLEVRRAIGRFLFPGEFEQPDATAELAAALKPFADLGVGSGPDDEHDAAPYRLTRGSIRNARAALAKLEA